MSKRNVIKLYPVNEREYSVAEKGGRVYFYANGQLISHQRPRDPEHRTRLINRWLARPHSPEL